MGIVDRYVKRKIEKALNAGMAPPPAVGVVTDARPIVDELAFGGGYAISVRKPEDLPWQEPEVTFPVGRPIPPGVIDPRLPDSNRPLPRRSEFPVGWNLPGQGQHHVPWTVLRAFADQVDVVRLCIGVRKKEIASTAWSISVKSNAVSNVAKATEAKPDGTGEVESPTISQQHAHAQVLESFRGDIDRITAFWERPDSINRLTFGEWLWQLLEEYLVLDALSIYPHPALSGDLHSLEILDGTTIKPLLDHRGAFPQPPQPAYQQYLYGFPRGEFTLSDEGDTFSSDELIYRPRDRRTWTPYGFSPTEQALIAGDLYLKRQQWLRAEYTDGAIPAGLMIPPESLNWTPEQVRLYENEINAELSGQTQQRMKWRLTPPGVAMEYPANFAERFNNDFDEYLIKLLCAFYDVMPSEIGFTPKSGLGGAGHQEGEAASGQRKGNKPLLEWLTDIFNEVNYEYLKCPPELTFKFELDDEENLKDKAAAQKELASVGGITLNDIRSDNGQPLYDFPEADEPYLATPTGPVFFRGLLEQHSASIDASVAGSQASIKTQGDIASGKAPPPPRPGQPVPTEVPPKGQEEEPPPKPKPDPAADPVKGKAELATFAKYAKRREGKAWRDFNFEHVPAPVASFLNETRGDITLEQYKWIEADLGKAEAREHPGQQSHDNLVAHFAARIARAMGSVLPNLEQVVEHVITARVTKADDSRWTQEAVRYRPSIDSISCDDCTHWRAPNGCALVLGTISPDGWCDIFSPHNALYKAADPDVMAMFGDADPSELEAVLQEIYRNSYGAGAQTAKAQLGIATDWTTWTPGHAEAAERLAGDGLSELLGQANISIKSILDSRMGELANALSDAVDKGWGVTQTADAIRGLLENPDRADMIATTEINRGMTAATLDTYHENGVSRVNWLLSPGACELCIENSDASPIDINDEWPNGDPPVHPNCMCALSPVVEATDDGNQ